MPFPAGYKGPNAGKGRPKGSKNARTEYAREAIARFVDGNAPKLSAWLDEIYEHDGAKAAFQCFSDLVEYHVPKLARTELTGDQENPVTIAWPVPAPKIER